MASAEVGGAARPAWRTQPALIGAVAGVVGGLVFGLMMALAMPPMMGMIGSLVGAPSLGWGVHLVFSAIIGLGFGVLLGSRVNDWPTASGFGLAYGVVWWILGPLLIMPTWLGMGPMLTKAFDGANLMSLMGHVVFGVVTGLVYRTLSR